LENFGPATFGALNASDYDETQDPGTTQQTVDFIHDVMGGKGYALELAIGTGRVAIPLAARGITVSGIEASPDMLAKMWEKPDSNAIHAVVGDMADVNIDGEFDHAFLIFNTLFNLLSQEAQVRCFQNVALKLPVGGTFIVEAFVPNLDDFVKHQRVSTKRLDMSHVWLEAATHDPVRQMFEFQRIRITEEGMKMVPLPMRYAYPPELDLMAQLAGMRLRDRYGSWTKTPFDKDSGMHVSVYEKI
jgi:hypothetical protein